MTINASTLGASLSLLSRLDSIKRGNRNRNEETLRSIPTQAGLDPVLLVPRPLRNCQNPRQTHISLPCIGEGYFFSFGPRSLEVSIGGRPCRVIAASDKGKSLLFSEAGVTWSIYCTKKRCRPKGKRKGEEQIHLFRGRQSVCKRTCREALRRPAARARYRAFLGARLQNGTRSSSGRRLSRGWGHSSSTRTACTRRPSPSGGA